MLGLSRKNVPWQWSVTGKHPAFGDYLHHNLDSPMVKAFSAWVERGMAQRKQQQVNDRYFSYRFWTRGGKKHSLVCGIVKDSSDTMGRSYPLVIMGSGTIHGWEKRWNTVFQAFDPVLREFEEIASKRFDSFSTLEARLRRIFFRPSDFTARGARPVKNKDLFLSLDLSNRDCCTIALGPGAHRPAARFERCPLPVAAFMGGAPEAPVLTVYARPLVPGDFRELFSGSLKPTVP
ncbi:MAG: type VI secretion system-associated protein TagF [Desulfobacteraceae bacterium]|nr:type VI secretion system-associated protein TagF [Desulfobacteraceae bacterium]